MGDDDNGVRVRNGIVNLGIANEGNRNQNGGRQDLHANPLNDGLNDQKMLDIDELLEDPPNQNLQQIGLPNLNQQRQRNEVGGWRLGDQGLGAARPNQGQQMPLQNAIGPVRQDVVPRLQRQNINADAVGNQGRQDNRANRGGQPPADGNQVRHNAGVNQGRQDKRAGGGQPPVDENQIRNNSNRGSRGTRAGQNRRRYTAPRLNPYERDLKNVAQYFVEVALSCTSRTRANLQRERTAREREEEDDQED